MSILRLTSDGRQADGERAQAQAEVAHLGVALVAGGGAPQGRVRLLPRLGLHPAPGHLPVLALELVLLVGPAAHDVADGLLPHLSALGRVDAEALELGPGGRPAGAHVDPSLREQVEHGHRLRRPHRMVVGLGHEAHAVAEADALGARRDGAVEHLGVRAVRVLLQEVVLDGPEGVPAVAVARRWPARACSGRPRARCPRPRGAGRGSRRTARTSWRGLPP